MQNVAALKQLRLVASQGMPPKQAIPVMLELLCSIIPSAFANFTWLDEKGWPSDAYLPVSAPTAQDAFIGNYAKLYADPDEPSLDKYIALNLDVGARVIIEKPSFRNTIVYNEVFRDLRISDGLDLTVRDCGHARAILFVNRDGAVGKWTTAEKEFLRSTHSHFLAALDGAPVQRDFSSSSGPVHETCHILADRSGGISLASPNAGQLLREYLDLEATVGFSNERLLRELPPELKILGNRLARIASGQISAAARDLRVTRWGEFVARVYPASLPQYPAYDQIFVTLEKRLSRTALVARNVGALPLAPKERLIAYHVGVGLSSARIAAELGLSPASLKSYLKSIYGRLECSGRDQLQQILTS